MAIPEMKGPHRLTDGNITMVVNRKTAGAYCLGPNNENHTLAVKYVGRSDRDLAGRLANHILNYHGFTYLLASSPADAYLMECELYHHYNPPDNDAHPAKPEGTNLKCPVCGA